VVMSPGPTTTVGSTRSGSRCQGAHCWVRWSLSSQAAITETGRATGERDPQNTRSIGLARASHRAAPPVPQVPAERPGDRLLAAQSRPQICLHLDDLEALVRVEGVGLVPPHAVAQGEGG